MKFGDLKALSRASRELESHLMADFPLETDLQRKHFLNSALDIFTTSQDPNVFINAIFVIQSFCDKARSFYDDIRHPFNRKMETDSMEPNT